VSRGSARAAALLLTVVFSGLVGCGSGSTRPQLIVSAATSLKHAFGVYDSSFRGAQVRASFAGSDILAAQIEQGVRPDVFASANLTLPELLYAKGLVAKPVTFAANQLVLAVPAQSTKVRTLADLERAGVTLAIGSPSVPIGIYTRKILGRLGARTKTKILGRVRSEEPDVSGIVGKLSEGAVDAGFTYITDVKAAGGKLRAIMLPAALHPVVQYGVAVVSGSRHAAQARQFIAGLLSGSGRAALLSAGFQTPSP